MPLPKRKLLEIALLGLTDEAFGAVVAACLASNAVHAGLWADGLGGYTPESQTSIHQVNAAAYAMVMDADPTPEVNSELTSTAAAGPTAAGTEASQGAKTPLEGTAPAPQAPAAAPETAQNAAPRPKATAHSVATPAQLKKG